MPVDLEHRLVRRPGGRPLRRELAALALLAGTLLLAAPPLRRRPTQ